MILWGLDTFLTFPNFLRSYVLNRSATREAPRIYRVYRAVGKGGLRRRRSWKLKKSPKQYHVFRDSNQLNESAKWRACMLTCFSCFTRFTYSRAWRAIPALRALLACRASWNGVLGMLQKNRPVSQFGVLDVFHKIAFLSKYLFIIKLQAKRHGSLFKRNSCTGVFSVNFLKYFRAAFL